MEPRILKSEASADKQFSKRLRKERVGRGATGNFPGAGKAAKVQEQITFLNVERLRREAFRFTLQPPHDPARAATLRSWDVDVDPEIIDSFSDMLAHSVEKAVANPEIPGIHFDPFVAGGRGLYDALLPHRRDKSVEELRDALRDVHTPLLITHDDPSFCWELLHDGVGEGFLGLKLNIGRRLRRLRVPEQTLRRAGEWRCLVIADPCPNEPQWALPDAREEAEKLCRWLHANHLPAVEFLHGEQASFSGVLERLAAQAYDMIHYAGHVVADADKGTYALRLHGGRLLGADPIRNHVQGAPVVFLNSCWSARASGFPQPQWTGLGMTDAFLEAGAQAVIGSLFPAPDVGARAFAEAFYRGVLDCQTIGEAMRQARKAVLGADGCGPAWACFVLYGDPCLRIEASVMEPALRHINLHSSQFGDACLRILEEARRYAGSFQPVSTAHLFAALIDGSGCLLANALRQQQVPAQKLRDLFQELFEQQRQRTTWTILTAEAVGFSAGTRDILWEAVTRARTQGKDKVLEEDMLFAFVRMQGGSTGHLLRKVGVDLRALVPAAAPVEAPAEPVAIGPLAEPDCDADAWQILLSAAQSSAGAGFVGTSQLFQLLLEMPGSPLARGMATYGMALRAGQGASRNTGSRLSGKVPCSDNLKAILLLAQANAAAAQRERVIPRDLLDAFVAHGGGETGRYLMENGVLLEVLVCDLFLETGDLDIGRFTEEATNILEATRTCAVRKGNDRIDRDHLLYGMLHHSPLLRERLGSAGSDLQGIIDRLYTRIPSGLASSGRAALRVQQMTPLLLKVLCLAASAKGEGKPIDGCDLLRAWLLEGGGRGAELLLDHGVSLSGLVESTE